MKSVRVKTVGFIWGQIPTEVMAKGFPCGERRWKYNGFQDDSKENSLEEHNCYLIAFFFSPISVYLFWEAQELVEPIPADFGPANRGGRDRHAINHTHGQFSGFHEPASHVIRNVGMLPERANLVVCSVFSLLARRKSSSRRFDCVSMLLTRHD